MISATPIIIRLEVQRNAPFVNLNMTTNEDTLSTSKTITRKCSEVADDDDQEQKNSVCTVKSAVDSENRIQCLGTRKYSEMVVHSFVDSASSQSQPAICKESESISTLATSASASGSLSTFVKASDDIEIDKISFYSGNPFVEKTCGVLHFYKRREFKNQKNNCSMLCMLSVPSYLPCRELLKFIEPSSADIGAVKVIRDSTPNQYMVILKFKSYDATSKFFEEYNGVSYNSIEPEICTLVFVEKVETVPEEENACLSVESLVELPTCAVCLERLDDGVLTILCNHTFHSSCLEQWADSTCPVCRHNQTPELLADQKCLKCGRTTDLWICLICGNIGCGRYAKAHAFDHFNETSHTFTLQVGTNRVWDYAGDNYVHRLIHNSNDGKVVECARNESDEFEGGDEKIEAIQLEYTYLLTSQLEKQRAHFEKIVSDAESRFIKLEKFAKSEIEDLTAQIEKVVSDSNELKREFDKCKQEKSSLEKKFNVTQSKLTKALNDLSEEKTFNALLRSDQEKWSKQVSKLEKENTEMRNKFSDVEKDLNEQIRDLMMHFEAQSRIKDALEDQQLTQQELADGSITVPEVEKNRKNRRKPKK